jgi:hypothetical protein
MHGGGRAPDVCRCNAAGRLATHRQLRGAVRGGPRMEAAYIVLPPGAGGKSMAVAIEKQAILALQARTTRLCLKEIACFRSRPRLLRAPMRVPWCQTQIASKCSSTLQAGAVHARLLWCAWQSCYVCPTPGLTWSAGWQAARFPLIAAGDARRRQAPRQAFAA